MKKHKDYGSPLRIYDYGDKVEDRYTILPPRWARAYRHRDCNTWEGIATNAYPFHPQGFGQHIECPAGPHLGKRITWQDLPEQAQQFARQTFPEFAP